MQFVIMDLEWNNTYAKKTKGYLNEIIEIGAVKLDESLTQVDTFSQLIRSQIGKKLRGSVKKLTNITNADINSGELFTKVFSDFRKWLGKEDTVIFTWGDGDIRVLVENFTYLNGIKTIPFIKTYCDLQACYHKVANAQSNMQVGLHSAAQALGIDPDSFSLHRALGDSLLTAEIFRRIYDSEIFEPFYKACNSEFYERLFFKAKVICNIDNPLVDKSKFCHSCEKCGEECVEISEWKYHNQFFRAVYFCPNCKTHYSVGLRFKKYFDRVEVRKIAAVFDPEQKKKERREKELAAKESNKSSAEGTEA